MGAFPYGRGAYGPFQEPAQDPGADVRAYRNVYFVDNKRGRDGNPGLSVNTAFSTVQKALDTVQDEDTIIVMKGTGSYDEQLTTGQNIRHAAMTPGRGRNVSLVGATPTYLPYASPQLYNVSGDTATLVIRSPSWRISGFRIVGDSGSPICLDIEMAQAGNTADTNWAPGTTVDHCVFLGAVGSTAGIEITAAVFVRVQDCMLEGFTSSTLAALKDGAGGFSFPGRCSFQRNEFVENVVNLEGGFAEAHIAHNVFIDGHVNTMTTGIDLENGLSNAIYSNQLGGTYQSGGVYTQGSGGGDNWVGNFASSGTNVTGGISDGVPGA